MDRLGFRADTVKKVEQGLFRELRKKAPAIQQLATQNVKQAFFGFNKAPIDTAETQRTTFAQVLFGYKNPIVRFKSENIDDYAQFPLLGKSTSSQYEERNWLKKGLQITAKDLFKSASIKK